MADLEDAVYPSGGRRDDSPVDTESRNEREGSRESDHDDRDRRRRGGGYERDLRRESRRYAPYPSQEERSGRRQSGSSGKECRVYVWNLPYTVKWQDLKDFMKKGTFVAINGVVLWGMASVSYIKRVSLSTGVRALSFIYQSSATGMLRTHSTTSSQLV